MFDSLASFFLNMIALVQVGTSIPTNSMYTRNFTTRLFKVTSFAHISSSSEYKLAVQGLIN